MIIDGKKIAEEIQAEIKLTIDSIAGRKPCLAVILVGTHLPSQIYVERKTEACASVGIRSIKRTLPSTITEEELLAEVENLNQDPLIDGILIQLPLPPHMNPNKITHRVNPNKDVDGFHPLNVGKMLIGETDGFFPCTPLGVRVILDRMDVEVAGKHALVIGRSNIVGKPMAAMLMQSSHGGNATVTIAHRHSQNLKDICRLCDIVIVAVGQPNFVSADMIKEGAVVIDVGINKIVDLSKRNGYSIVGDVDFANVKDKCSYITPVPGGVGPMTIAMLLSNTLRSYQKWHL